MRLLINLVLDFTWPSVLGFEAQGGSLFVKNSQPCDPKIENLVWHTDDCMPVSMAVNLLDPYACTSTSIAGGSNPRPAVRRAQRSDVTLFYITYFAHVHRFKCIANTLCYTYFIFLLHVQTQTMSHTLKMIDTNLYHTVTGHRSSLNQNMYWLL